MNLFKWLTPKPSKGYSVKRETIDNIKLEWEKIDLLLKQKSPSQLRQALIYADKCLDNALRDIVPGETMGDRLKNSANKFNELTYDKIWKAHKVRNNLVHEAGYEPPHFVITEAIENLKTGLKDLGAGI